LTSLPNLRKIDFEGAPKGAFELASVINLYSKFGRVSPETVKQLQKRLPDLCQELNDIDVYILEIALRIYYQTVARKQIAYHPKFFINLAKKQAGRIKPIKRNDTRQQDRDFKIPNLGKAI